MNISVVFLQLRISRGNVENDEGNDAKPKLDSLYITTNGVISYAVVHNKSRFLLKCKCVIGYIYIDYLLFPYLGCYIFFRIVHS